MSKAFTKDDDSGPPRVVPKRAPLPDGVPNYVTARGLLALRAEHHDLARQRAAAAAAGDRATKDVCAVLDERLVDLDARLARSELVSIPVPPPEEVRFGAHVTLVTLNGAARAYRIVGVDEADPKRGSIAFVAPLARAVLGKRVGDTALVRTPHGEEELEIVRVEYCSGASPTPDT